MKMSSETKDPIQPLFWQARLCRVGHRGWSALGAEVLSVRALGRNGGGVLTSLRKQEAFSPAQTTSEPPGPCLGSLVIFPTLPNGSPETWREAAGLPQVGEALCSRRA